MNQYSIRFGMAPDAGAISVICSSGFYQVHESGFVKEDLESFCKQAYSPEAIAADLARPDRFYIVLDFQEQVVGCLRMAPPSLELAKPDSKGFELARFYLETAHQSGGWGGKMLDAAEAESLRRGYENSWLHVFVPNTRAQAFYTRHGYTKIGEEQLIYQQSHPTGFVLKKTLI
ncbi:GNAT family N-acetyltransferase [Flavihumibacter sp. UBA7668]|uniref:GNAT family N-acetyltransferase n=1 Tax=Flavihumibacter sp. UBA7668 TaxID=1946542 RepID=UPI0025BF8E4B|nr:GNAT family N-acetyltransferase [Flavihumibacter sp. UBA7668]